MAKYDGEIRINTKIDTKGLKSGYDEIKASAKRTAKAIISIGESARKGAQNSTRGLHEQSQQYKEVQKQIEETQKKINKLEERKEKFLETGGKTQSRTFKGMQYDLEELRGTLQSAISEKEELLNDTGSKARGFQKITGPISKLFGAGLNGFGTAFKKTALGIGGKPLRTMLTFAGITERTDKGLKGLTKSFSGGFFKVLKYAFGIRSLYVLFNKLRHSVAQGMNNLVQFDSRTNKSVSDLRSSLTQLKNSFATAFAPILNTIAPILNSFLSLISKAITYVGMFIAVLTGQKTFTKAVYAQEDYAASLGNTADSAKDAADNTKDAAKATKEYLSGLDEIRKFEEDSDDDKDKNGGGGSGGGGGGGVGPSDMFETVEIPSFIEDWADKFKEAWENADFTEIGTIVGTKLKNALDNIDWDSINATGEKIAKSTATFINGFMETPGLWESVGKTMGEGFNTSFNVLNTFLENLNVDSIGKAITTTIQSAFETIDWGQVTRFLSNVVEKTFDFGTGLLEGIDWEKLPGDLRDAIEEAIDGIDVKGISKSFGKLLGTAFTSGGELLKGFREAIESDKDTPNSMAEIIIKAIEDAFEGKSLLEIGKNIITGMFDGMLEHIKGVGKWIKTNVVDPFVEGFEEGFGDLPSLKEIGQMIMDTICDGMIPAIKKIPQFIKEKVKELGVGAVDIASNIALTFTTKIAEWIEWFLKKIKGGDSISKTVSTTISSVKETLATWLLNKIKKGSSLSKKVSTTISSTSSNLATWVLSKIRSGAKLVKTISTSIAKSSGSSSVVVWLLEKIRAGKSLFTSVKVTLSGLTAKVKKLLGLETGGIYKNGKWQPIEGYARGGSPKSARLFYANENGIPELVGRIGSNTAVMNNGQIVASVADGVYRAVVSAFSQLSGYFASINNSLAYIPPALDSVAVSLETMPIPMMATGSIIPPKTVVSLEEIDGIVTTLEDIKDLLEELLRTRNSRANDAVRLVVPLDGKVIFDRVINLGRLARQQGGQNPFELA